jgi:hypothetical protein
MPSWDLRALLAAFTCCYVEHSVILFEMCVWPLVPAQHTLKHSISGHVCIHALQNVHAHTCAARECLAHAAQLHGTCGA